MAIVQNILNDIDLRYRNTFTVSQKLVWMSEEQLELFEILEIDSDPYNFPLQTDVQFYPIPSWFQVDRIKTATIQINDDPDFPQFAELPWRQNDDRSFTSYAELYYTIVGESFFIPNGTNDDRQVYFYMDVEPSDITTADLSSEPAVPVRFQELLKLGVLKRIAMARKDSQMFSNYSDEYEFKLSSMMEKMALRQPEFYTPVDTMPAYNRNRTGRYTRYTTITVTNP